MRRPPNNMKCELLQFFYLLLGHLPSWIRVPGPESSWIRIPDPGPGLDPPAWLDTDPVRSRIRIWIRTRSPAYRYPLICGILYGGPDSDPDPCPGAGSGSGSAGPIWFGSGPGLGRGPDLYVDPELRPAVGREG